MKLRRNAFQKKTADIKGMRGDFAWYVQGTARRPEWLGQNEGKGCKGDEVWEWGTRVRLRAGRSCSDC